MIRSRMQRAKQQRLYLLAITNTVEQENPCFAILGSTGNVYTVSFQNCSPKCNCFDHRVRKSFCKHIIFVLLRILKIPEKRIEQLSTKGIKEPELQVLLSNVTVPVDREYLAPQKTVDDFKAIVGDGRGAFSGGRKAQVPRREASMECPICFESFSTGESVEPVLYCKWGCGNAVHKDCFDKWSASRIIAGQEVTCVYCRTPWERLESSKTEAGQFLSGRKIIKLKNPHEKENILIQRELSSKSPTRSKKSSSKAPRKKKLGKSDAGTSEGVRSKIRKASRKKKVN